MENISLLQLIRRAYGVHDMQVQGPAWLDSARFDILATFPSTATRDQRSQMLQAMLVERFSLKTHKTHKKTSGYALVVASRVSKLEPSAGGASSVTTGAGYITGENLSIGRFVETLWDTLQVPVADNTGLPGVFNIKLSWSSETPISTGQETPDLNNDGHGPLLRALQDVLGLKLQKTHVVIEVVVVDQIERYPIEN